MSSKFVRSCEQTIPPTALGNRFVRSCEQTIPPTALGNRFVRSCEQTIPRFVPPGEQTNPEIKNVKTEDCIPMPELGRNFYNTKHYFALKQALEKEGWKPNYPASAIFNKELGKWEIFVGIHRLKIAKEIGLRTIPLVPSTIPRGRAIAEGINSNLRQGPYNPIDIARHLAALGNRFVRSGEQTIPPTGGRPAEYNMRAIAKEYGFGLSTVHMYLSLLKLPEEEQTLVGSGNLGMRHAIALLPLEDPLKISAMAERCIRESWTVSETERRVEMALKNPSSLQETFEACQGCGRAFEKDKMTRLKFCPSCIGKIKDGCMKGPTNIAKEDSQTLVEYAKQKEYRLKKGLAKLMGSIPNE